MGMLQNRAPRTKQDLFSGINDVVEEKKSYRTMAFKVEEDLQKEMRLYCLQNGKIMATVLNNLMRNYLKENAVK